MMPANSDNLVLRLLTEFREELTEFREETNRRFDETNRRLDTVATELKTEIQQSREQAAANLFVSELRQATQTNEQIAATRDLRETLEKRSELENRIERCEHDIAELKEATKG